MAIILILLLFLVFDSVGVFPPPILGHAPTGTSPLEPYLGPFAVYVVELKG